MDDRKTFRFVVCTVQKPASCDKQTDLVAKKGDEGAATLITCANHEFCIYQEVYEAAKKVLE